MQEAPGQKCVPAGQASPPSAEVPAQLSTSGRTARQEPKLHTWSAGQTMPQPPQLAEWSSVKSQPGEKPAPAPQSTSPELPLLLPEAELLAELLPLEEPPPGEVMLPELPPVEELPLPPVEPLLLPPIEELLLVEPLLLASGELLLPLELPPKLGEPDEPDELTELDPLLPLWPPLPPLGVETLQAPRADTRVVAIRKRRVITKEAVSRRGRRGAGFPPPRSLLPARVPTRWRPRRLPPT